MSNNAESWNQPNVVSFFDINRTTTSDIYPSEWFFLKEQLKEGMSILDIGCAQGGFAGMIAEHLNDFTYTGVDISEEMISKAKEKYPQHNFHIVKENDYSKVTGKYDVSLVLGILHLHETWRNTIQIAWNHTKSSLILDLREVFEETVEDKKKSYFKMDINGSNDDYSEVLPYNLINSGEALEIVNSICTGAEKISFYGYSQDPAKTAVTPTNKIFASVYLAQKGR
jgi:SAM-dependent methyltransferase|tara:strand:- start:532 stop:1209 length:678 start_codon:yes stop_codon:yes gene_type:complete